MKNAAKIKSGSRGKVPFIPSALSRQVGAKIKKIRESKMGSDGKPLTLGEMSNDLWGASPEYLAKVEAGNSNITLSRMMQIATYLDVEVYDLLLHPDVPVLGRSKK